MPRDFQVNGETMVSVKGGAHLSGHSLGTLTNVGLSPNEIIVSPNFKHKDVHVDDFGPDIPNEIMWMLSDVHIRMALIHCDREAILTCMRESMAGGMPNFDLVEGYMAPTGSLLGNGIPVLSSGCHFMHLNLQSPVLQKPWRFLAAYLTSQPLEIPLSTRASVFLMDWRAIPYQPVTTTGGVNCHIGQGRIVVNKELSEILSSGALLWDYTLDE